MNAKPLQNMYVIMKPDKTIVGLEDFKNIQEIAHIAPDYRKYVSKDCPHILFNDLTSAKLFLKLWDPFDFGKINAKDDFPGLETYHWKTPDITQYLTQGYRIMDLEEANAIACNSEIPKLFNTIYPGTYTWSMWELMSLRTRYRTLEHRPQLGNKFEMKLLNEETSQIFLVIGSKDGVTVSIL